MTEMCFKILLELGNWGTGSEAGWDTVPNTGAALPPKSLYLSLDVPEVGCCRFWIPSPLYIEAGH